MLQSLLHCLLWTAFDWVSFITTGVAYTADEVDEKTKAFRSSINNSMIDDVLTVEVSSQPTGNTWPYIINFSIWKFVKHSNYWCWMKILKQIKLMYFVKEYVVSDASIADIMTSFLLFSFFLANFFFLQSFCLISFVKHISLLIQQPSVRVAV